MTANEYLETITKDSPDAWMYWSRATTPYYTVFTHVQQFTENAPTVIILSTVSTLVHVLFPPDLGIPNVRIQSHRDPVLKCIIHNLYNWEWVGIEAHQKAEVAQ